MIGQLWRRFSLRAKGLIVALIPLMALLTSSFLFYKVGKEEQQAQKMVDHTLNVRDKIDNGQRQLEESETRLRGYLLGGNRDLLERSLETRQELVETVRQLQFLVQDNPIQTDRAKKIGAVVEEKNAQSAKTVANYKTLVSKGLLGENVEESRILLDKLRGEFYTMEAEEERLRILRTNKVRKARSLASAIITIGALIGVLGGLAASLLFTLSLDRRVKHLDVQARALAEGQPLPNPTSLGSDTISSLERELGRTSTLLIERQNSLHETNEHLNHLVSSMPGVLVRLDKNLQILYASPNAPRVFGYEVEEMMADGNFFSKVLHPEDRDHIMVSLTKAIIEKVHLIETERRVRHKTGEYHWMHSYVRPEYDEQDQVISLLSYSVDVTELKRTQEALRESEALFRNSFDLAPIGITLMTMEGKWLMANRAMCDILGYTEEEFLHTSIQQITHPEDVEIHHEFRQMLLDGIIPFGHAERRYIHRDGHVVWVQIHVSLVRNAEGEPVYFIGQVQDISERKRIDVELAEARDAALESARAKASFMANMSHEIRTPMNGIFGMIGLLNNTRLEPQQRDFVETMRESADALLVIINDILDFSKIEAGKMEMERVSFDLNTTVESSLSLLAAKSRARGVEFGSIINQEVPTLLRGDAGRLRQVLLNLLDNAIKFTPDGGAATLRVDREHETESAVVLNFSVTDSGIGIDEEAQRRLFQPFAQADGSTTRRFGGTGLGLAICKQLVELMGGTIGVQSVKGEGSTFWFTACFEKQTSSAAIAAREKADMSQCRVLIVDSGDTHRDIVQQQVASWNFSCEGVGKGTQALEQMHQRANAKNPYQIVLINRQLDDMDAMALVHAVRTVPIISETRLIVMTQPEDDVEAIRNAGADAVLSKPIRQSQLFNCLTEIIEGRKPVPTEPAPPEVVAPPIINANSLRILVAEDNAINQKVVLNQLKNLGHHGTVVTTGIEAIEAWQEGNFDLILMDCHMPEMDGYTASRKIRGLEGSGEHIPIIALTANVLDGDRELCIASGMDDYLAKPVNQADLDKVLLRMSMGHLKPLATPEASGVSVLQTEHLNQLLSELPADLFKELVDIFLQEVPQLISELNRVWESKNLFQTIEMAHKLKGSCATLGATRMSQLCERIQSHAEAKELDPIPALLLLIEEEFVPVEIELNRYARNHSLSSDDAHIREGN